MFLSFFFFQHWSLRKHVFNHSIKVATHLRKQYFILYKVSLLTVGVVWFFYFLFCVSGLYFHQSISQYHWKWMRVTMQLPVVEYSNYFIGVFMFCWKGWWCWMNSSINAKGSVQVNNFTPIWCMPLVYNNGLRCYTQKLSFCLNVNQQFSYIFE